MQLTRNFRDGRGQVPASKHPNGGGWVAASASVGEEVHVGPNAVVFGHAHISGGNIRISGNVRISGHARIHSDEGAEITLIHGDVEMYSHLEE